MEELAPLLDSSAEKPRNEQAMSTKCFFSSNRSCLGRKKTSGRDSRGTLGRLLLVPQSERPGHTQAGGRPTLRLN